MRLCPIFIMLDEVAYASSFANLLICFYICHLLKEWLKSELVAIYFVYVVKIIAMKEAFSAVVIDQR